MRLPIDTRGFRPCCSNRRRLKVERRRQVIRVDVGLQNPDNGVSPLGDEREESLGRRRGDGVGALVVVQDWVNDGGVLGLRVCDDVLKSARSCLEDGVNGRFHRRMVVVTGGCTGSPSPARVAMCRIPERWGGGGGGGGGEIPMMPGIHLPEGRRGDAVLWG